MTIYETNFSDQSLGSPPDNWTERWNESDGNLNIISSIYQGGKALHVNGTSIDDYFVSWDDCGSPEDVEVLMFCKPDYWSSSHNFGIIVRASGGTDTENGYGVRTYHHDRTYFNRYLDGSMVQVTYTDVDFFYNDTDCYWFRFSVIGDAVKIKVWNNKTPEPEIWTIERTDTNISSGGWVGLHTRASSVTDPEVYWFAVSDDGSTIPVPEIYLSSNKKASNVIINC